MTRTIAISGKGGTGKTTVAALLSKLLSEKGVVLAIDGDPSSNLNLALGLPLADTVGDVREEMLGEVKSGTFAQGVTKKDYLELKIQEALVESPRIDLLAMGRPEGPGCYCAANHILRVAIDRIASNYDYVVIDNEAGMEHISRQTTRDVDVLLLVSDMSMRGLITAVRMKDLIAELRTKVGRIGLVLNRVSDGIPKELKQKIEEARLELWGTLPEEPRLTQLDARGVPVVELPPDSPLRFSLSEIASKAGLL